MNNTELLPLEELLRHKSMVQANQPFLNRNIFHQYQGCLSYLKVQVYPFIDAGLAALSEESGIYTLHGPDHFAEVVKYAGLLLEASKEELSAYELFVLLVAIRVHDAGNMYGREQHEKRTYQILAQMGDAIFPDQFEVRNIAAIAAAHGGKTPAGSKDTISELRAIDTYGTEKFRPQLLAAIVRFADEICENRSRAAEVLLDSNSLPQQNEVFHKYAATIKSVLPEPAEHRVVMIYQFMVADANRKWGKNKVNGGIEEVYLIEEIFERLEKMFRERQYCKRFMRNVCDIEHINARIEIHKAATNGVWSHQESIAKLIDVRSEAEGYPLSASPLSDQYQITGESLMAELRQVDNNESNDTDT